MLGPAGLPKHEALKKLAAYIATFTPEKPAQTTVIRTYADLWRTFSGLKSGQWSQPFRETIRSVFATHVLPVIGKQRLDEVSLSTLQLLVNQMAEDGYSKSSVRKVRMYLKAIFEVTVLCRQMRLKTMSEVRVIARSVARKGKKDELRALLKGMLVPTRGERGCKSYELYESDSTGRSYFDETWESHAALDKH